jgi:hypothetical protein
MKKYFKRLLFAFINKTFCDCENEGYYHVVTRKNGNLDLWQIIDDIEEKLYKKDKNINVKK